MDKHLLGIELPPYVYRYGLEYALELLKQQQSFPKHQRPSSGYVMVSGNRRRLEEARDIVVATPVLREAFDGILYDMLAAGPAGSAPVQQKYANLCVVLQQKPTLIRKEVLDGDALSRPHVFKRPGAAQPSTVYVPGMSSVEVLLLAHTVLADPEAFALDLSAGLTLEALTRELQDNSPVVPLVVLDLDGVDVRTYLDGLKGLNYPFLLKDGDGLLGLLAPYKWAKGLQESLKTVCPELAGGARPATRGEPEAAPPLVVADIPVADQPATPSPEAAAVTLSHPPAGDVAGVEGLPADVEPVQPQAGQPETQQVESEQEDNHDTSPPVALHRHKRFQRGAADIRWDEVNPFDVPKEVQDICFTVQSYDGVPPEPQPYLGQPQLRERPEHGTMLTPPGGRQPHSRGPSTVRPRNELGGTVAFMLYRDFENTVNRIRHAAQSLRRIEGRLTGHRLPHRTQLTVDNWHAVAGLVLQARVVDISFPENLDENGEPLRLTAFPAHWMEQLPAIDIAATYGTPLDPMLQGDAPDEDKDGR